MNHRRDSYFAKQLKSILQSRNSSIHIQVFQEQTCVKMIEIVLQARNHLLKIKIVTYERFVILYRSVIIYTASL